MTATSRNSSDGEIVRLLQRVDPALRDRMASILAIAATEGENEGLRLADEVEMQLIEEVRCLGQETLQSWAVRQAERASAQEREQPQTHGHGKKS